MIITAPIIFGMMFLVVLIIMLADYIQNKIPPENRFLIFLPCNLNFKLALIKSFSITIINYAYNSLASKFVFMENHKYKEDHEKSLILKIFVFRMINNLTAIIFTAFVKQDIDEVKYLIYELLIVKDISDIGLRFVYPGLVFFLRKKRYFYVVRLIQSQKLREIMNKKNLNNKIYKNELDKNKLIIHDNLENRADSEIHKRNENFLNDYNDKKQTIPNEITIHKGTIIEDVNKEDIQNSVRRLKFINCSNTEEESEFNPDTIEINSFLDYREDLVYYYSDVFI